ncbi:hypothetical protein Patl1_03494 [Pistacia atlantica]|uniref:Uncharacterized protein n=1 Tax=Pistacia atlantica TaxID=434234 RepID=A0ACC1C4T1_9ROSI|nr:hypothetical protein Patl1_03494 [Pistacia atlantica]
MFTMGIQPAAAPSSVNDTEIRKQISEEFFLKDRGEHNSFTIIIPIVIALILLWILMIIVYVYITRRKRARVYSL